MYSLPHAALLSRMQSEHVDKKVNLPEVAIWSGGLVLKHNILSPSCKQSTATRTYQDEWWTRHAEQMAPGRKRNTGPSYLQSGNPDNQTVRWNSNGGTAGRKEVAPPAHLHLERQPEDWTAVTLENQRPISLGMV